MGLIFSRDAKKFAGYEKSLERNEKERLRLKERQQKCKERLAAIKTFFNVGMAVLVVLSGLFIAWVQRQPEGTYGGLEKAHRVGSAMLLPCIFLFFGSIARASVGWSSDRDLRRMKKLEDNQRAIVRELKDSTRYVTIDKLVRKYDPDVAPPPPPQPPNSQLPRPQGSLLLGNSGMPQALLATTGSAAVATVSRAALFLDRLANNVIGDNPQLQEELRNAQSQLHSLAAENRDLRQQLEKLGVTPQQMSSNGAISFQPEAGQPSPQECRSTRTSTSGGGALGGSGVRPVVRPGQGVADAEQQVNQSDGNAALTSREDQEVGSPHQENPNN